MIASQRMFRAMLLVLIASLASCSIYRQSDQDSGPVVQQPDKPAAVPGVTLPQPRPPDPPASAAWRPLLTKAEQATSRGDYEQALALLQRAQRIDPDSAEVYLSMAITHRARGDSAQARATAERGLLYCLSASECDALRGYTH